MIIKGEKMDGQYYVGWLALAFINANLAEIKNTMRGGQDLGGFAWLIISLFLGPIATLLILIIKRCDKG